MSSPVRSRSRRAFAALFAGRLLGLGVLVVLVVPFPVGAVATSGTVLIPEERVVEEDLFAAGSRVIVEGTIKGDLTVTTRRLIIRGVVEGDVNGLAWSVDISGQVGGTVRTVAWTVDVSGSVGDDLMAFGRSVEVDGDVGRDLLVAAVSARNSGTVGREIRGELLWSLYVDGAVERDIDVGVHRLTITDSATVGQAVSYRRGVLAQNIRGWAARADISDSADVGLVAEVKPTPTDISVKALRLLFQLLRFVGLLFTGIVLIGVFPSLSQRAADRVWRRPGSTFLVGLLVFVLIPVAFVVTLFTVVLAPLALLALGLWLFGLIAGAVPPLVALGRRLVKSRFEMVGAFVVAAIGWRVLRLVPLLGFFLYFLIVIWGMGAWVIAVWEGSRFSRRKDKSRLPAGDAVGPRMELLGLDVPGS
jgi:cytoskeletal protein CcmA (bactofilin family)